MPATSDASPRVVVPCAASCSRVRFVPVRFRVPSLPPLVGVCCAEATCAQSALQSQLRRGAAARVHSAAAQFRCGSMCQRRSGDAAGGATKQACAPPCRTSTAARTTPLHPAHTHAHALRAQPRTPQQVSTHTRTQHITTQRQRDRREMRTVTLTSRISARLSARTRVCHRRLV